MKRSTRSREKQLAEAEKQLEPMFVDSFADAGFMLDAGFLLGAGFIRVQRRLIVAFINAD